MPKVKVEVEVEAVVWSSWDERVFESRACSTRPPADHLHAP